MTERRDMMSRRLRLEVGFEPRRGSQEALTDAYERLLPPRACRIPAQSQTSLRQEGDDAAAHVPAIPESAHHGHSRGALRPRVHRTTS